MRGRIGIILGIFFVSGFSGLIYESIWTHYLKILLGHAAHAQTLVLALFMGCMAFGAWLASARMSRIKNLLRFYAVVEGAIGCVALVFHELFIKAQTFFSSVIAPCFDSPDLVNVCLWALASLLIIPQSILLGMTFPLMAGGLTRVQPERSGYLIAFLYFSNSFGGSLGVLAAGFLLIPTVGLPGAMLTAGLMNVLIALAIWLMCSSEQFQSQSDPRLSAGSTQPLQTSGYVILLVSFFTGWASFIYEIVWIRMLSLVLGSAFHSFELMLSSFILGLALGGFWIRKRIDQITDLWKYTVNVQVLMAVFALLSLAMYGYAFNFMALLIESTAKSDNGHSLYLILSNALVLSFMLPTTFCAGMTLPLLTSLLLKQNAGIRCIGWVYSSNTFGAILGVLTAVHITMPLLGLKDALMIGAGVDIIAGVLLFAQRYDWKSAILFPLGMTATATLFVTYTVIELDTNKMASGVYRYGASALSRDQRILFHKDGKTASVDLIERPNGTRVISTNGKPDAAIAMMQDQVPAPDEITMILAAALPLALRPDAATIANIGMGSGLTTSVLLSGKKAQLVDTIEIEAAMIEAARKFLPRVAPAYDDPRSRFYIDDAKAFFAVHKHKYDIIVSEPSNPWVSGVASLFSMEFYHAIKRYLSDDGLFVQWIQAYETNMEIVSSAVKALGKEFDDYLVFNTDNSNLLFIASATGPLKFSLSERVFANPKLVTELNRVGIETRADLELRFIGSKELLEPLFLSYISPINSDFFPYIELNAPKARFLKQDVWDLVTFPAGPLPIAQILIGTPPIQSSARSAKIDDFRIQRISETNHIVSLIADGTSNIDPRNNAIATSGLLINQLNASCRNSTDAEVWMNAIHSVLLHIGSSLATDQADILWSNLRSSKCMAYASDVQKNWIELYESLIFKQPEKMANRALAIIESGGYSGDRLGYLIAIAMLGYLAMDEPQEAIAIWDNHAPKEWSPDRVKFNMRLILANARYRRLEQLLPGESLAGP